MGKTASRDLDDAIDLYMSTVPALLGHIRSNKLRAIAVTSAERSDQLKDVQTLAEAGVKDFNAVSWFGIMAPAGTPSEIARQLNAAFNKVLTDPGVKAKLNAEGSSVEGGTPEQFAEFLKQEVPRWAEAVKESAIRME